MPSPQICLWMIWCCALALLIAGLMLVTSATPWAGEKQGVVNPILFQVIMGAAGLVGALVLSKINYNYYRKFVVWIWGGVVVLLLLCFLPAPIGVIVNGESRWINLGVRFQPSEVAKLGMVITISYVLAINQYRIKTVLHGFLAPVLVYGVPLFLILIEKDISTTGALGLACICILWMGRVSTWCLAVFMGCCSLLLSVFVLADENRMGRIVAWMKNDTVAQEAHQQVRAGVGMTRGGIDGLGIGQGMEKHGSLPYAHTDFIFATAGEEWGLYGTLGILLMFYGIIFFGILLALQTKDTFGKLITVGITCVLFFPAVINIAVVTRAFPNTGLPLPFISYGGTSLFMSLVALGVLTSVQRYCREDQVFSAQAKDRRSVDLKL